MSSNKKLTGFLNSRFKVQLSYRTTPDLIKKHENPDTSLLNHSQKKKKSEKTSVSDVKAEI